MWLNVHLGNIGSVVGPLLCLAVYAHIVPDTAMSTAVLLRRVSSSHFPVRKYRVVSTTETVATFLENENAPPVDPRFNQRVKGAVGMIEGKRKKRVVVRVASHNHCLPNAMSWLQVHLANTDGTDAAEGYYYISFGSDWFPQEAIVEAGTSEIPLQRLNADGFIPQRLGVTADRLKPCKLDNAQILRNELSRVNAVVGDGSPEKSDEKPPATVLSSLNALQRKAFLLLRNKIPAYLRPIHFDLENNLWTADDIDALGDLLCKYAHRFLSMALIWDMLLLILSALF